MRHQPTVKQAAFLLLDQREALFGGAAGGGKSDALLLAALQYVDVPGYSAILFRKTFSDLALPGALLDRARSWLEPTEARWNQTKRTWSFPSGATLAFGYLDRPVQKYRYQSSEFQFIGFDELTQFGESEYTYLFSRLRRLRGMDVPLRMRAASNPGGTGHAWVKRRFLSNDAHAKRVFLPASLDDNPYLDRESYTQSLRSLEPIVREQLLHGDWEIEDGGLLSLDDLWACQADCLWEAGPKIPAGRHELYLGVDIGRVRDRTVLWTWERVGDCLWCREVAVFENMNFRDQKDEIKRRLNRFVQRCLIDKGGIGFQLTEELEREHPGVVEGVILSAGMGGRLARRLAIAVSERKVRLPDDAELRDDFRQVRRTRIVGGVDKVTTERTSLGHADRFWSAALALEAARQEGDSRMTVPASLPRAAVSSR